LTRPEKSLSLTYAGRDGTIRINLIERVERSEGQRLDSSAVSSQQDDGELRDTSTEVRERPPGRRPRIMAVANQKGGVGKTTTTVNLAACIASRGFKILVIDMDPQGNATSALGIDKNELDATVYDVLLGLKSLDDVKTSSVVDRLWLVPANRDLSGAQIELVEWANREFCLTRALDGAVDGYDYVFLDCPPSLGLLTLNSLVAATSVIIPLQCEFYALEGVSQLLETVNLVAHRLNPKLRIEGVLLTMFDVRTNLSRQVAEEVRSHFPHNTFGTIIPRNVALSEAPSFGLPVIMHDGSSKGAMSYWALTDEVLSDG